MIYVWQSASWKGNKEKDFSLQIKFEHRERTYAMIFVILATCALILLVYWHYKIMADKETGFFYLLFCPQTKTVDGSKLSDNVRISKHESLFKNSFDLINLNPGE